MPKNLVPVAEYTGEVTVPEGADGRTASSVENPFQKLADRAAFAKAGLEAISQCAQYSVSGTVSLSNAKLTLAEVIDPEGVYSVTSNEVQVGAAGTYLILAHLGLTSSDVSEPLALAAWVEVGGDVKATLNVGRQASGDTIADTMAVSGAAIVAISSPSIEKITVNSAIGTTPLTVSSTSRLTIVRLA